MSSIALTNVTKSFGDAQVIQPFTATFADHEFVTLLGPSGCGKTTLLRMIAGFERPTTGEIRIGDMVASRAAGDGPPVFVPPERRGIGMVFQSYAVWPHMDVSANVAYPLKVQRVDRREIERRVGEILESVHLSQYARRMPNELSGGQQQRVALARALVADPSVLLLDEPLSNLDAKLRDSMRFEIKEVQQRFGITVVYVTHDQTEAMAMSDRIVVLDKGTVRQIGTPMEIYRRPAGPFVAGSVGKIELSHGVASAGQIELTGGQRLPHDGPERGPVIVAVRPEDIALRPRDADARPGTLRGTLVQSWYLGDTSDCRVDVDGTTLRATTAGRDYGELAPGTPVWLDLAGWIVFEDDGEDPMRIVT